MRIRWTAAGAAIGLLATASLAHAHGGMAAPNEVGPPILTAVALGLVCYWLVVLWPSSRSKDEASGGGATSKNGKRRGRRRAAAPSAEPDLPRLTKIAGGRES
jgi:hypothetical protein